MRERWPQFNWDDVDAKYPGKEGIYAFSRRAIAQRGVAAREFLKGRKEKVVVVVSHSGFLRVGLSHRFYENADFRIFDFGFKEEGGGELVEWGETEWVKGGLNQERSGGMGKSPVGVWVGEQNIPEGEVVVEKP